MQNNKAHTLDDLYTELAEVQAYRQLQDTTFNFGGIDIIPNNTYSEDAYYRALEASILDAIANYNSTSKPSKVHTVKHYNRNYHTQRKWKKITRQ